MLRSRPKSKALVAVDLFAGGGGLTVGLKRAGFSVVGAIEIEPHAIATYKSNHSEVHVFNQDASTIKGEHLLELCPNGQLDLLAGCPPCQGFTSLTSKYKRRDPRNDLIREMGRLIRETRPRAVMMENVPGLLQRGKPLFREFAALLMKLGYVSDYGVLQAADYGIPQCRRRLVLLAGKGFRIQLPRPTHCRFAADGRRPWRTIREVMRGLPKPVTLQQCTAQGGPQCCNWHVVRSLTPRNQQRLGHAVPGRGWTKIPKRLRPDCHKDKSAGFGNVYGRMSWDQPSPTITAGCTTLSKGRFGHPNENRTISVREAALLQTFPPDYVFDTPWMEYVCDIIGNALPCDFGETIALACLESLRKGRNGSSR